MTQEIQEPDPPAVAEPPLADDPFQLVKQAIAQAAGALRSSTGALLLKTGAVPRGQLELRVDEVLQEACLRAMARAADFDPSQRLQAWLMGFGITVVREQHGRQARRPPPAQLVDAQWESIEEKLIDDRLVPPDALAAQTEQIKRLQQAMALLTAAERAAIHARFYQGLEGDELAAQLGASNAGCARVRIHRALRALERRFHACSSQEVSQ